MTEEKIARINALAKKSKTTGLTEAEKAEQQALQMPFPVTTSPVKMEYRSVRRRSGIPKFKILFPLNMPRAKRRAF